VTLSTTTRSEQTITTTLQFLILNKRTARATDLTYANQSICQGFILIWLRILLFLDRCMVLFSFYVEVFVENACVCIRLIGPTYVVVLFIWLFAVFTVMLLGWSSRLSMWIKLILSYLILSIQLSNEYSYKLLCWPNVTSQSQTSLTVKKTSNPLI